MASLKLRDSASDSVRSSLTAPPAHGRCAPLFPRSARRPGERAALKRETWFTGTRLLALPSRRDIEPLAARVRRYWEEERSIRPFDPEAVFGVLGWRISTRVLGARGGGHRAMLIPLLKGGFSILVDPDESDEECARLIDARRVRAVRLAHELAHTFFYSCGRPPTRLAPLVPEEETFCDLFAAAVLRAQ